MNIMFEDRRRTITNASGTVIGYMKEGNRNLYDTRAMYMGYANRDGAVFCSAVWGMTLGQLHEVDGGFKLITRY